MAKQQSKSRRPGSRKSGNSRERNRQRSNGRSASEKPEEYRFARNLDGEESIAEHTYRAYAADARKGEGDTPDVLIDVPVVKVDSVELLVEDLELQFSLHAKVLEMLEIDVGVEAYLEKVKVDLKGVEAQALLQAKLDHVTAIVDRVMTTLDRNPELMESIGEALEEIGMGTGRSLDQTGEAVDEVGEGARDAAEQVGEGAGEAAGEVGKAVGGAGQAVGGADGAGGGSGADIAKNAATMVAKEIGAAASDEAKELGMAAARKAKELGGRRRQKRAERHNATEAALRTARELGVDLEEIEGTGSGGRITVGDVRNAAQED